jgi:hypothetical protein
MILQVIRNMKKEINQAEQAHAEGIPQNAQKTEQPLPYSQAKLAEANVKTNYLSTAAYNVRAEFFGSIF